MPARINRDAQGTSYTIDASPTVKSPGGTQLPGMAAVVVWWARRFKGRSQETLIIRQESQTDRADVIEITLGQVYDLIDALNKAVERT